MNLTKEKKKHVSATIPTASMADVAFLLLIFFLVTTKFDTKKGLGLILPPHTEAGAQKVKIKKENLTQVWVNAQGEVAVDEQPVSLIELESVIRRKITDNPKMVIALTTDRKAKYYMMVQVLDRLQKVGAKRISLSTR